jgi:hypothetical protein
MSSLSSTSSSWNKPSPYSATSSLEPAPSAPALHTILSSPHLKALPRTSSLESFIVESNPHLPVRRSLAPNPRLQRWDSADFYSTPEEVRAVLATQGRQVLNEALELGELHAHVSDGGGMSAAGGGGKKAMGSRRSSGLSLASLQSEDVRPYHSGPLFGSFRSLHAQPPFVTGLPSPSGTPTAGTLSRVHKRWDSGEFYGLSEEERALAPTQSRHDLLESLRSADGRHEFQPRKSALSVETVPRPPPPAPPGRLSNLLPKLALGESVLNTTPVKKTHKRWDSGEFYTLPDEERSMAKTNSRQDLLDTLQWGSELVDSAQRRPRRSSLSVEKLSPN